MNHHCRQVQFSAFNATNTQSSVRDVSVITITELQPVSCAGGVTITMSTTVGM